MTRHPCPGLRTEVAHSGSDNIRLLKFAKCILGKDAEISRRTASRKFLRGGTGILRDKEKLELRYVRARLCRNGDLG